MTSSRPVPLLVTWRPTRDTRRAVSAAAMPRPEQRVACDSAPRQAWGMSEQERERAERLASKLRELGTDPE